MGPVRSGKPGRNVSQLGALLRCPRCGSELAGEARLVCDHGHVYSVVGGVPRLLEGEWDAKDSELVARTRAGFGKQWQRFADDAVVTKADLMLHLPADWTATTFSGLVLDVGCGMGRYAAVVSGMGATVVGLDPSDAIQVAATRSPEAFFVQADIVPAPFPPRTFDLVYSFGVLHHLPDPLRGLHACFDLVRPGGAMLVWVYSERHDSLRRFRQKARAIIRRVPLLIGPAAWLAALCLWSIYLLPARLLGFSPERLLFYADKGFRQLRVDCYDALQAPIEAYVSREQCRRWIDELQSSDSGFEKRRDGSGWILWARA